MPSRVRLLSTAAVVLLVAGCSGSGEDERQRGSLVTTAEAEVLAGLLAANAESEGADFVVTAPYAEGTVLTLTGEVDFAAAAGRAQAVTTYADGRPDDTRTVFFTPEQLWFGDVPGLSDALSAAELPDAAYVRRPVSGEEERPLVDVVALTLLNLTAAEADDPGSFATGGHTWQGERSVDGELTSVYAAEAGWTVAVDRSTDLLVQFSAPLPGTEFEVTVTLSDHAPRSIPLPAEEEAVDGAEHPDIAALVGL